MGSLGEVDHGKEMFHGHGHSDPVVDELNRLQNLLREKERELGHAYSEIKGLKVTEALKDKAIAELSKELKKQDEKIRSLEKQLEQKNLEVKRLNNERKEALSAQFAAEATIRRIHSSQKDEESVPFDAIIAPLESDIRKYRHEIAVLQDDKKALERHLKLKEVALVEASNILRSALERALIVEDVQNQNIELKKQMEIYHEENKLLEKANRQKVLEVEKLTQTIGELEESILATSEVANAVHFYQNQATKLNEEKKTLERELARAKVYVNRVASTTANEWKDDSEKLMPVKRWLEERRLLQGEIQRLRDKITIAEKSSKIEAQLNDKLKRRLKSLEDDMRNETSNSSTKEINKQATPRRSTSQPKQHKTTRVLPQPYSHESIDRRRPISQPRASVAGKVLKQPNSETKPIEKTRVVNRFDSPRARTVSSRGECPVKNQLWASKGKVDVVAGKENKTQKCLMEMMNMKFKAMNIMKPWRMREMRIAPVMKVPLRTTTQIGLLGFYFSMRTHNGRANTIIMYRCNTTCLKGSVHPSTTNLFCLGDCLNKNTSCGVIILSCLLSALLCTYKLCLKVYKCNFAWLLKEKKSICALFEELFILSNER